MGLPTVLVVESADSLDRYGIRGFGQVPSVETVLIVTDQIRHTAEYPNTLRSKARPGHIMVTRPRFNLSRIGDHVEHPSCVRVNESGSIPEMGKIGAKVRVPVIFFAELHPAETISNVVPGIPAVSAIVVA